MTTDTERFIAQAKAQIDRRNTAAEKVRKLEDRLYKAKQELEQAERLAWHSLPDGCQIMLSGDEPWELVAPHNDRSPDA